QPAERADDQAARGAARPAPWRRVAVRPIRVPGPGRGVPRHRSPGKPRPIGRCHRRSFLPSDTARNPRRTRTEPARNENHCITCKLSLVAFTTQITSVMARRSPLRCAAMRVRTRLLIALTVTAGVIACAVPASASSGQVLDDDVSLTLASDGTLRARETVTF